MAHGTCSVAGCNRAVVAKGWCDKHYRRWLHRGSLLTTEIVNDDIARFWSKVVEGPVPDYAPHLGPCWIWSAGCYSRGYGHFSVSVGPKVRKHLGAHRWSYEYLVCDIPDNLELDHLCRVRKCVNPYHLEPVTHVVNARRGEGGWNSLEKTHCPEEHEYSVSNTYVHPVTGRRTCRTCQRIANRVYHRNGQRKPRNRKRVVLG